MKRAFYDFGISPYSYDFVSFLMCAKSFGCDEVVFVPGKRMVKLEDGTFQEFQKCSPEEQEYRLKHLLIPLVSKYVIAKDRAHAKHLWHADCFPPGYTVDKPLMAHTLRHVLHCGKLYPLSAKKELKEEVKALGIGENTVTITIRHNSINPKRNSNIPEWIKAAHWLKDKGYEPVFIPDTEDVYERFEDFRTLPQAALDVQFRIAVYDSAMLNIGINTGPMTLCLYSKRPMLYFKALGETFETSAEFWIKWCGLQPGQQPPWFNDRQRIIWEANDDHETLIHYIKKWLDVRDHKDKWDPMLAPNYPIKGVLSHDERHEHMRIALSKGFKKLPAFNGQFHDGVMSIVCYGPSLRDTWQEIKHPIMTVSGAHDFLIERGVIPDYHVDCDPRPHKSEFVKHPHPGVKYLMASCCHPQAWEYLKDSDVTLWHLHNGDETAEWLKEHAPEDHCVGGGTTVGSRAIVLSGDMGYRRFEVYGMDCSFTETETHAGNHTGKKHTRIQVRCGNEWFWTSPQMVEAAREIQKMIAQYDIEIVLHGNGLLSAMALEAMKLAKEAA